MRGENATRRQTRFFFFFLLTGLSPTCQTATRDLLHGRVHIRVRLFVQDYPISRDDHTAPGRFSTVASERGDPTSAVHVRVSRDSNPDRKERLVPLSSLRRSLFPATLKVKNKNRKAFLLKPGINKDGSGKRLTEMKGFCSKAEEIAAKCHWRVASCLLRSSRSPAFPLFLCLCV